MIPLRLLKAHPRESNARYSRRMLWVGDIFQHCRVWDGRSKWRRHHFQHRRSRLWISVNPLSARASLPVLHRRIQPFRSRRPLGNFPAEQSYFTVPPVLSVMAITAAHWVSRPGGAWPHLLASCRTVVRPTRCGASAMRSQLLCRPSAAFSSAPGSNNASKQKQNPEVKPADEAMPPEQQIKAAGAKLASRLFQRTVTPASEREQVMPEDLSADPAAEKVGGFVYDQIKDRTYMRVRNAILTRIATGFGIVLPGLGLYFGAKSVLAEWNQIVDAFKQQRRLSAAAFSAAAAADCVNVAATGTALGKALREHAPLHWPTLRENPVTWYSDYADAIGISPALGPGLALASTLAAAAGELYLRYDSISHFAHDKAPTAAKQAEKAINQAKNGDVGAAAATAAAAAHTAVDEGMPDMTIDREAKARLGDAVTEAIPAMPERAAEAAKEATQEAASKLEEIARETADEAARATAIRHHRQPSDASGARADHEARR